MPKKTDQTDRLSQSENLSLERVNRRANMMETLYKTLEILSFHGEETIEDVMSHGLRPLADGFKLDLICLYQYVNYGDREWLGQYYRWVRSEGGTAPIFEGLKILPDNKAVTEWTNNLTRDKCVYLRADQIHGAQRDFLDWLKIKSALIVPIFAYGDFWGVVTFEDHSSYRNFETDDEDLYRSAARVMANAIILDDKVRNAHEAYVALKRREQMTDRINEAAILFLSQADGSFESIMSEGVGLIMDELALDRLTVWRNFTKNDGLHTSQIYRWSRAEGGSVIPKDPYKDIRYADTLPTWERPLSSGGVINGPAEKFKEREYLVENDVSSLFAAPIIRKNQFWGFVLFDDQSKSRVFEDDMVDMMCQAAFLIANNIISQDIEQEAITANSFNEALLDSSPWGMTVFNDELELIDCNYAAYSMLGCSKQFFLENFFTLFPNYQPNGEPSEEGAKIYLKRALEGERISFQWNHLSVTGEEFPMHVTLGRALSGDRYIGIGFMYDLRSIRKMEKLASEAEMMKEAVKEASPVPYILFGEDFIPVDCNDAALKMLQSPSKEYLIERYWEVFSPEFQPDGERSVAKGLKNRNTALINGNFIYEWEHITMHGVTVPVESTLTKIMINGRIHYISFKYDLTYRKRMTENLRKQSVLLSERLEQQELMSEIAKSLIARNGVTGLIESAIEKLGRYLKASRVIITQADKERKKTIIKYAWYDQLSPRIDDIEFNLNNLITDSFPAELPGSFAFPAISCRMASECDNPNFRPLAKYDVSGFICAALYLDGTLWGVISVEQCFEPRDWTENERSFVAMIASTISGAIQRDNYHTKLEEALKNMTAASNAKSDFLSTMSHEMRTPLNAIIGMTAIGKNAGDIERKDYALGKVEDASTHLLALINDVLDMSKIEANRLELNPVEFNFERMIQRVVSVINFRVDEKRQNLSMHVDRAMPRFIISDDQRLAQVITNLLSNAVKFTSEEGNIELSAFLDKEEDGQCEIRIEIKDDGIGIAPEQQSRLFKAFGQAESGISRKFGGTGLGLAISKRIVELMGGQIRVESELNKGSTFIFTIKAMRGKSKLRSLLVQEADLTNLRVLVVDDREETRDYVKEIFDTICINCDTAEDGYKALEFIKDRGDYDIYFVDWRMPGMDGIELTRQIKTQRRKPGIVIMISAADWAVIREDAVKAGVDRYLVKPLFSSTVIDCVNECLIPKDHDDHNSKAWNGFGAFSGMNLLLAEDVEINREILLTLLADTGLNIDSAENGEEALRMVTEDPGKYDMVFMDVQMPIMDGLEATRRIRALGDLRLSKLPIVAMTANVFREDIADCLRAGMDDHIGKPLDMDDVFAKLRKYLRIKTKD